MNGEANDAALPAKSVVAEYRIWTYMDAPLIKVCDSMEQAAKHGRDNR